MTHPAPVAVVTQLLAAPVEAVYDEWLDPEALAEWMCPRPARCLAVRIDARIGGEVWFDIEDGGARFAVNGRYLELERPRRLAFTWSCSTWPDPTLETVVTVTFEPNGSGSTLMTIEHALLPPDLLHRHAQGWTLIAQQLETQLKDVRESPGRAS